MENFLLDLFRRYGTSISAYVDDHWLALKGFLQPVTNWGSSHYLKEVSPTGEIPLGTYVYIGPTYIQVEEGGLLRMNGQVYRLCRVETIRCFGDPAYIWGLCVKNGGEDTWGQS